MGKIENLNKRVPFKKNDPRINKEGRPKKLPELDALLANVLGEEDKGYTIAEAILKALRAKALRGDIRAAELLLDRAYGKSKERIEQDIKMKVEKVQIEILNTGVPLSSSESDVQ